MCASLGLLRPGQASRLRAAGISRFNHNLESGPSFFRRIVSTHTWEDRAATVRRSREEGMEACCGGIIGMGEGPEDVVDLAFALRELEVESIPINFLDPRPGTALGDRRLQDPKYCLKVLAMFRFVHPDKELRVAGGREVNLRELQPQALYAVNSMFTEGYLTTEGNRHRDDIEMILRAGFEIEGEEAFPESAVLGRLSP